MHDLVCRQCWCWFKRPGRRGPLPRWCGAACRQQGYRARQQRRLDQAVDALAALADRTRAGLPTLVETLLRIAS